MSARDTKAGFFGADPREGKLHRADCLIPGQQSRWGQGDRKDLGQGSGVKTQNPQTLFARIQEERFSGNGGVPPSNSEININDPKNDADDGEAKRVEGGDAHRA